VNPTNVRARRLTLRTRITIACATLAVAAASVAVYLSATSATRKSGQFRVNSADAHDVPQSRPSVDGSDTSPSPSPSASPGRSQSASAKAKPGRNGGVAPPSGHVGFPDENTTGVPAGHKLTPSGVLRVTKPGTVIDGLDMHGDISVEADNVTIKNTRVITAGTWGIIQRQNAKGLVVQDCDIRGNGKDQLQHAIFNLGGMITIQRTDMSVVSDAISTSVGLIRDNYLHDPKYFPGDHTDMIQSNSGPPPGSTLVIRHNTVINTIDQTAAIALFQDFGVQHDAVIENNLLAGGGYALYSGAGAKGTSYNIRVVNNVFSRQVFPKSGSFGPVAYWDGTGPGNVWESNVWADTGEPVIP
jgi:hypothetical protein